MGRQALPINLADMQAIIDVEEKSYKGGVMAFYDHCATIYNNRYHPAKLLYGQVIYNRIHVKCELRTNFVKETGSRKLTPEHREKFLAGRKDRKKRSRANTDPRHEEYLRRELKDKPALVDKILAGSMAAAVKAKCLDCCCNDMTEIKKCTSYGCPLYNFRPYKEAN